MINNGVFVSNIASFLRHVLFAKEAYVFKKRRLL